MRQSRFFKFSILLFLISLFFCSEGTKKRTVMDCHYIPWRGYTVEWGKINIRRGEKIPYIFILPRDCENRKVPCVVALHGITGSKWEWTDVAGGFTKGGDLTELMLEKGYALFAIDFQRHGDRATKVWSGFIEHFTDITRNQWDNFYTESLNDIYHSLEFIKNRKQIDNKRLAVIGYSMGGLFSLELGKNTPEGIKTIIACVPAAIDEHMKDNPEFWKGVKIPQQGILSTIAWSYRFRSLLLIVGKNDPWSSVSYQKRIFSVIKSSDKHLSIYDCGHSLPHAYTHEVIQWLSKRL